MIGINIASGKEYRKGWINVDNKQMYHGEFEVDIEADVFDFDYVNNTVDVILVNHFIQYVTPDKMDILLRRWYGWLKDGGSIYIEAGNILRVCEYILKSRTIEELHGKNGIMQLYGIDDNIWNKWAWCPASLTQAMDKAGFRELFTGNGHFHVNPERDFITVGYKNPTSVPTIPIFLQK